MRLPTTTTIRRRSTIRRRVAGAVALALALGGVALSGVALARGRLHVHAPAISLRAPQSVAATSKYTIKVSGYFNRTKRHLTGADFAEVDATDHVADCTSHTLRDKRLGRQRVAGGPQDKRLRARTETTPGRFSATETVTAPSTGGEYMLCAYLGSYPAGGMYQRTASAHLTVQAAVPRTLTVSIAGSGSGDVSEQDTTTHGPLTDCRSGDAPCSRAYRPGDVVLLEAEPGDFPSFFAGWSGASDCAGDENDGCLVTMDADKTVTATFNDGAP